MSVAEAESVISCANDQAVWPWQAEPIRLWSLLDMIRFHNGAFAAAWGQFNRAWELLLTSGNEQDFWKAVAELREQFDLDHVSLSEHVQQQFRELDREKTAETGYQRQTVLTIMARTLMNAINLDLSQKLFLLIPAGRREFFLQHAPPFGKAVGDNFAEAEPDVAAAARCLALDEWAACVFHCMRVLESGIRPMARRFNVPFEKESWHAVLRGIETGIQALREKRTRSPEDDADITNYSEAAVQFRYFKDAWRNHVMHGRETYGESEAITIYMHVRDFMQKMSGIVSA